MYHVSLSYKTYFLHWGIVFAVYLNSFRKGRQALPFLFFRMSALERMLQFDRCSAAQALPFLIFRMSAL